MSGEYMSHDEASSRILAIIAEAGALDYAASVLATCLQYALCSMPRLVAEGVLRGGEKMVFMETEADYER